MEGEWIQDTSSYITHVNPATGEVNYEVCAGTEAHIDAAVNAAHKAAGKPSWRNMLPHNRAQNTNRIADLMMERSDLLARCQMLENGKVWKECKNQVINGAATFRYCAAAIETLGSEITPPRGNYLSMTVYEPWGVVAAITPWNSPITLTCNKIAAALAAGNGVVLKPLRLTRRLAESSWVGLRLTQAFHPACSMSCPEREARLATRWSRIHWCVWFLLPAVLKLGEEFPNWRARKSFQPCWNWAENRRTSFSPTRT